MRLTLQTDYALRILMALGHDRERVISVDELSKQFQVSKNHLMKTAQALVAAGFVATTRGRTGGLRLALPADEINIGAVVQAIEPDLHIAECFHKSTCSFLPSCRLRVMLGQARDDFMDRLGRHTLANIIKQNLF